MRQQPVRRALFASFVFFLCLALPLLLVNGHSTRAHARPAFGAVTDGLPVLVHKATQEFADIDGGRVVWQDARTGPTDIYLWSPTQPNGVNLTNSPQWEVYPDLDGDLVIWKDGYRGIGIHGLNIVSGRLFTVTVGQHELSRPQLSGQTVVWADDRRGAKDWNIYGYDLATQQEFVISDAPGNQADPQLDWPWVVWWDYQERIYAHNLASGVTQTVLSTRGARLPAVSALDQLVVWQDMRNGDWDLYGYDLVTNTELELVKAPLHQGFAAIANGLVAFQSQTPGGAWNAGLWVRALDTHFLLDPHSAFQTQVAVDGTQIVWQDSRNHQLDIFAYNWLGTVPTRERSLLSPPANLQAGALPHNEIVLQWEDRSTGESGFTIERATGITGTAWSELITLPAASTRYVDRVDGANETYWYRVRAFQADELSDYSNESFGTTFAPGPTADEFYLMTLINEARADPAHFGYADYSPVPPLIYNELIGYAARSHSQAILNSAFQFGHCDIIWRCPSERVRAVGYTHGCAENLTTSFQTGPGAMREAHQGFLASEGHRHNLLAPDLTEFGVGHTFDRARGDDRHGQVTEVFCGGDLPIPALPTGAMIAPSAGSNTFTFVVNYYSAQGEVPTSAQVFVDGQPYPLARRSGVAAHGTYAHSVELTGNGDHNYYFRFVYGDGKVAYWPPDSVDLDSDYALYLPFVTR